MGQEQFAAIMPYISADLVAMIAKKKNLTEEEAIAMLYSSKLYETLENEELQALGAAEETAKGDDFDLDALLGGL